MDTRQKVHTVDTRPCLNKQVSLYPHWKLRRAKRHQIHWAWKHLKDE